MEVQIFGLKNHQACRAAERFFAERRIKVHLVDLKIRPIAPGELKRFVAKLGLAAVVDSEGKAFRDGGLAHLSMSEEQWISRLVANPALLRLPLVRCGQRCSADQAPEQWRQWVQEESA